MKLLDRLFSASRPHNADETAHRLEELDKKALEERQLTRLTKSEFIDSLFQGVIEEVGKK